MGSFKKVILKKLRFWPLLASIVVSILNIDFVVIPALRRAHAAGLQLIVAAYTLSTLELIFWYWFWGWVIKTLLETQDVKESIEFGKQISGELKKEGYIDRIKNYFTEKFRKATNEKNKVLRIIKAGGIFSLLLVGASPEPGSRLIGIIFCKTTKWRTGFYFLATGNILHVTYVVGGWNLIFSFFK